jgi:hypothetical protein
LKTSLIHRRYSLHVIIIILNMALLPGCTAATTVPTVTTVPTLTTAPTVTTVPTATAIPEPKKGTYCNPVKQENLLPPQPTQVPQVQKTAAGTPIPAPTLDPNLLSMRAGFGMANSAVPEYWARALDSGWYLNWDVEKRTPGQLPEHWQTVRVGSNCIFPNREYLAWAASNYPGDVWIIGNEPDVIWQDNVTPEEFARLYHDAYQAIKTADPTAKIAVGGIAQGTPLRLAYLDRVLAEYQQRYHNPLPADWWTVHGYVLREQHNSWGVEIPPGFTDLQGILREVKDHGRLDLFKDQLVAFRSWMAKNGYRTTPLALTEFGILMPANYGFPTEFVVQYLNNTFDWLQNATEDQFGLPSDSNHLVQRWAWFSLAYDLYPSPNLANLMTGDLTPVGEAFREYVLKYHP